MNNEQKQYILRKPVTILHELDYSLELNLGEYMMPVDKDCFKDEFVPLDVSGLTRQVEIYEQYLTTMKSKYLPDGIDKLFELYKQELVDEQQILNILQGFKQAYTLASAQISRWTDETNLYVVWSCTSQACHELLKALKVVEALEEDK